MLSSEAGWVPGFSNCIESLPCQALDGLRVTIALTSKTEVAPDIARGSLSHFGLGGLMGLL